MGKKIALLLLLLLVVLPCVAIGVSPIHTLIHTPIHAASLDEQVDVVYDVDGEAVSITVKAASFTPVSILIQDADRKYYIDQIETDAFGKAVFQTRLAAGKAYTCLVSSGGEQRTTIIRIDEHDDQVLTPPQGPATATLYIEGYKGVILPQTKVELDPDDSVLDLTRRALDRERIPYKIRGGYVAGIDGQEEFDRGPESGWMFSVNGRFPNVGAGNVDVSSKDHIKWLYTQDLGKDVGYSIKEQVVELLPDGFRGWLREALSIIDDKKATEEDVLKVLHELTNQFTQVTAAVKNSKQAKSALQDLAELNEALVKGIPRLETEAGYKQIAQASLQLGQEAVQLLKHVQAERDAVQALSMRVSENQGIALVLINRIKDEKIVAKLSTEMMDLAVKLSAEMYETGLAGTRNMEPTFSAWIPQESQDRIQFTLKPILLAKSEEKELHQFQLASDLLTLRFQRDALDATTGTKGLTITGETVTLERLPAELSSTVKESLPRESTIVDIVATNLQGDVVSWQRPLRASIPFTGQYEVQDGVAAFFITEEGLKPMGGLYDPVTKKVSFWTDHFSLYVAKEYVKSFVDTENHWAAQAIGVLAGKGIIHGRTAASFAPDASITRAEFTTLIIRMLGYDRPFTAQLAFDDVAASAWYYEPVAIAYHQGLVSGKSSHHFDPNGKITRQEMTKIIANLVKQRLHEEEHLDRLKRFTDYEEIAPWAQGAVALSLRENLINGMSGDRFAPQEHATRAQAAIMLYRLNQLLLAAE